MIENEQGDLKSCVQIAAVMVRGRSRLAAMRSLDESVLVRNHGNINVVINLTVERRHAFRRKQTWQIQFWSPERRDASVG